MDHSKYETWPASACCQYSRTQRLGNDAWQLAPSGRKEENQASLDGVMERLYCCSWVWEEDWRPLCEFPRWCPMPSEVDISVARHSTTAKPSRPTLSIAVADGTDVVGKLGFRHSGGLRRRHHHQKEQDSRFQLQIGMS